MTTRYIWVVWLYGLLIVRLDVGRRIWGWDLKVGQLYVPDLTEYREMCGPGSYEPFSGPVCIQMTRRREKGKAWILVGHLQRDKRQIMISRDDSHLGTGLKVGWKDPGTERGTKNVETGNSNQRSRHFTLKHFIFLLLYAKYPKNVTNFIYISRTLSHRYFIKHRRNER